VIGTRHNGANTDICIWKYLDNGNLDITFGTGGRMIYDSGNDEEGLSILKITICRFIALGYTYRGPVDQFDQILWNIEDMCPSHTATATLTATPTATLTLTPTLSPTRTATALSVPGCFTLDSSFDGDGIIASGLPSLDAGFDVALDSNNKILVSGYSTTTSQVMTLWRYNQDGSPDTSLGGTGYVYVTYKADTTYGSMVIDSSNRLIVSGINTGARLIICRLNNNGSFDTAFNGTGYVTSAASLAGATEANVAVDPAGRIVAMANDGLLVKIWRFNSNGTPDLTFNSTGVVSFANATGYAITTDSSGKILAAGSDLAGANGDMGIWRFNTDGSPDITFNGTGHVIHAGVAGGNGPDAARVIKVDASGKILAAGTSTDANGDWQLALWRYNDDGTLDTSFNSTGYSVFANPAGPTHGYSIRDMKIAGSSIYVTGNTMNPEDVVVFKFSSNGVLDTALNGTGYTILGNVCGGNGVDDAFGIYASGAGEVYVTGVSVSSGTSEDMFVLKYKDNCVMQTITPTPTVTLPVPQTQTFTATSTFTATVTPTSSITPTFTPTDTVTMTATCTQTATNTVPPTPTVTATTPCGFVATPVFSVVMIFNPESSDDDIFQITSNTILASAPYLTVHPHGQSANKPALTFPSSLIPAETMKYRVLYPKQTGYGDVDYVEISYADICGNSYTAQAQFEKSVISQKDVQLFKNVINPDQGERTRIDFKIYGGDHITVKIYSRTGVLIKNLYDSDVSGSGWKEAIWDGTNTKGEKVASGIYYAVVVSDFYTIKEKIAVIR